jgi:hypothetical protein
MVEVWATQIDKCLRCHASREEAERWILGHPPEMVRRASLWRVC